MKNEQPPIRYPADAEALKRGCYYDPTKELNSYIKFAEHFCLLDSEYDHRPISFFDFQLEDIVGPMLGWRNPDGTARHSLALIYGPKKFGKSTICASLCAWWAATKKGQNVILLASKVDQATIIFDMLRGFTKHPALAKRWHIKEHTRTIIDRKTQSRIKIMPQSPSGVSGPRIDLLICDEMSEWPSHSAQLIWDRVRYADAAKTKTGLKIIITTPSHEAGEHVGFIHWQMAKKIVEGTITDDIHTQAVVYGADPADDWTKEATWWKAGPHVGNLVSIDYYKQQYQRIKGNSEGEVSFRIYLLGQYVQNKHQYINQTAWKKCEEAFKEEAFHNHAASIGLDYGGMNDILSWVVLAKQGEVVYLMPRAAITKEALDRKTKLGQTYYLQWMQKGALKVVDEATISIDTLEGWLEDDYTNFNINALSYDPYGLKDLQARWQAKGRLVIETPPYARHIGPLLIDFERHIKEGKIRHAGHPILNFSIENLRVTEGKDGRLNTTKMDDKGKIDAAQATILGFNALDVEGYYNAPVIVL